MLFDAHIHLSEIPLEQRVPPLPAAALCSVHDYSDPLLSMHEPGLLFSYGIHPLWLDGAGRSLETLEKLAEERKIAAVGEFGFDFYEERDREKERWQKEFFHAQCAVAERFALPAVIHVRRGMAELFAETPVLKRLPAVIFHCYPGTAEEGLAFLKRGVNAFFSFGTPLIKKYPGAITALKGLPRELLLFETDAPFQPPRGRMLTFPADIVAVYEKGAELLEINKKTLEEQIWRNACSSFSQLKKIS